ncbi:MAG TPA: YceI family protein [Gammaproteobacteria bacterium]|nr:YceI family protein [Gammaproteobacteria bacterium]
MFIPTIRTPLYFWVLLLFSSPAFSDWNLVTEESKLNFISIKASNIAEIHSFKKITGSVKENGEAQLTINLASLETLIPIRNERMGKLLFETKIYPSAFFKLEVDLEKILLTEVGKSSEVEYRGMFGLKNKQFPLLVKLKVTRLNDQSFSVSSSEPLLLNADRLGLSNGIESLRAVAGLPSISKSVSVTFSLMFRK